MLNKLLRLVNLRLFDGEGEGEPGTAGLDTAVNSSQPEGEVVVYGKGEDEEEEEISTEEPDDTTVDDSSNTQGQEEFTIDFSKITPEKRPELYKQLKENFKDEFTKDFQSHFDRRFKTHKEYEGKLSKYEPLIETLMKYHGAADIDALAKVIDNEVLTELAEREGFPNVEKYKDYLDSKKKGELYEKKTKEETAKVEHENKINTWVEQGIELRKTYPDFDLSKEILNPTFAAKLEAGLSIEEAYFITHKDEIIQSRVKEAAKKAEENTVTAIKSKSKRILENGLKQTPGVVRKADPSKLSDKDMEEIAERVRRGEKIKF